MDHVAEHHGNEIAVIRARCVDDLLLSRGDEECPKNIKDFFEFPERCGWVVSDDYVLTSLPSDKGYPKAPRHKNLSFLLEAWLFFGLIYTIVQVDGKPLVKFSKLVSGSYLSTKHLHEDLEAWAKWEAAHEDSLRFRMVQVGWILDHARQVLRKNCAYVDGQVRYDSTGSLSISDELALVLMCLGETLCQTKARIMQKNKAETAGWHADDQAGWGPPKYVFGKMESRNQEENDRQLTENFWCPRTVQLLKGQLASNATMLVAALFAYQGSTRMKEDHKRAGCTAEKCLFQYTDTEEKYGTRHFSCKDKSSCERLGPPIDKILETLAKGSRYIPLLQFSNDASDDFKLNVVEFNPDEDEGGHLVTISHVWSDGWGNETTNELNRCQLNFIRNQITRATGSYNTRFWMDTLVVPVGREKKWKKLAVRQIFDVFDASTHTIILDNGLSEMGPGAGDKPAEAAMRILSSVWMRRLWTLQEAYLSRNLCIPFKEEEWGANNVVNFDKIEEDLKRLIESPTSGMIGMVRDQLSYTIMGEERRNRKLDPNNRNNNKKFLKEKAATVVANAWRAARWRTTSKDEHEVLALATLLNLEDQEIEEAGLSEPPEKGVPKDVEKLEKLVQIFWKKFDEKYGGAIPSGMIFLPGDKVNIQGYGWAPRTWLSAHEMDYPDPLSFWNESTVLDPARGLRVSYPGFLLHTNSIRARKDILGTTVGSSQHGNVVEFSFPVDRSLNEWYKFTRVDARDSGQLNRLATKDSGDLAIILSRPQPRRLSREIALLVEIYRTKSPRTHENSNEASDPNAVEYYCRIVHRIMIWRETGHAKTPGSKLKYKYGILQESEDNNTCLGEVLGPNQRWWVDGYIKHRVSDSEDNSATRERHGTGGTRQWAYWDQLTSAFGGWV
ncbi:hypothetical protein F4805DRAFT_476372 [Annulohypoxylon moriforme]|nr:hypothetical protein F4805DRAFT_476372 [Annulohypoxylon moriforme]